MAFTVDTDRIQTTAGDISRIAHDIETSVTAMAARMQGLQSAWTGTAATEWQALTADWRALQLRLREDLVRIGALTSRAGASYQQTEDSVRGLFAH